MKITAFTVLILLYSIQTLHAQERVELSAIKKSSYATITARVMKIAYERLGMEMVIKDLPAQRALHEANAGFVDGELYRIKNVHLKYTNLIMIPTQIGIMEGVAITKENIPAITSWEELSKIRTCIRNGVKFSEAGTRNFKVRAVSSNPQLFSMLEKNRCDAIVIARLTSIPMGIDFMKRTNIKINYGVLQVYPLYHYLHKKNESLAPKLIKVLEEMQAEGVMSEIREQFISEISTQ